MNSAPDIQLVPAIQISSPEPRDYGANPLRLDASLWFPYHRAVYYSLDGSEEELLCQHCDSISVHLGTPSYGWHSVFVRAIDHYGQQTNKTVDFRIRGAGSPMFIKRQATIAQSFLP
ncbi:MAG: hypothetical protein KJ709_01305 [Nanoarchaeota archaeon]|nr:hypothetical protein [Nanoarchaeota archaeon]